MGSPTPPGYVTRLELLVGAVRAFLVTAEAVEVDDLLNSALHMDTIAPLLEPTAWMRGGGDNLADQVALLRAAKDFVAAVQKMAPADGGRVIGTPGLEPDQSGCVLPAPVAGEAGRG